MEENASSSGQVKVEYHDPHNVFHCVVQDFQAYLPLRNLSWNAPHRPSRLIDTLFIRLAACQSQVNGPNDNSQTLEELNRSQNGQKRESDTIPARRERRHQIPGLRQTPYIKVLLVRCDDTESYKSSTRKEVRDWIKAVAAPSQKSSKSSNQENHDAYEWMILHVVLPDSERRVVWPDKTSNKIQQYLRDDFNSSSKNALDRVSQVPSVRTSQEDGNTNIVEPTFAQQANDAWEDVLGKLKKLILSSFDRRVRQYEEDIKEKGAQRTLPGWNFNTFFVLKEGLARGFESVGLVEDALSGYDELQVELDAAIQTNAARPENIQNATIFRETSPEVEEICKCLCNGEDVFSNQFFDASVLNTDRKQYRDLILSSDISLFDFKTYVFGRQVSLLQRMAISKLPGHQKSTTDLRFLHEICQRAMGFIASTSVLFRNEILLYSKPKTRSESSDESQGTVSMDSMATQLVSAWTYAICIAVLKYVDQPYENYSEVPPPQLQSKRPNSFDETEKPLPRLHSNDLSLTDIRALLINEKGVLLKLAQRVLEAIAFSRGWKSGWTAVTEVLLSSRLPILKSDSTPSHETEKKHLWDLPLKDVIASESSYRSSKAALASKAQKCFADVGSMYLGKQMHQEVIAQTFIEHRYLEVIEKIQQAAANYPYTVLSPEDIYTDMMLCRSLEETGAQERFVRSSLELAAKLDGNALLEDIFVGMGLQSSSSIFGKAISSAENLEKEVESNFFDYVDNFSISPHISHHSDHDGYQLAVEFSSNLLANLSVDQFTVSLTQVDSEHPSQCSLTAKNLSLSSNKKTTVLLSTTDVVPGRFLARKLSMQIGKIKLVYEGDIERIETNSRWRAGSSNAPKGLVTVWQTTDFFDINLKVSDMIDLDGPKSLLVSLKGSTRDSSAVSLRLRPGTAGLRLHTSKTQGVTENDSLNIDSEQPGLLFVEKVPATATMEFRVPFHLDQDITNIVVHTEMKYESGCIVSTLKKSFKLSILLPLGVNVQDIFKSPTLVSRFSISSSTGLPLRILHHQLQESVKYAIESPSVTLDSCLVLNRQPVSLVHKISRRSGDGAMSSGQDKLRLKIMYTCIDEEVAAAIRSNFTADITEADLLRYVKVLEPHLIDSVIANSSRLDFEQAAISGQLQTPSFDDTGWSKMLGNFPLVERVKLENWLKSWHLRNQYLLISDTVSQVPERSISIPVDVPTINVLQTAKVRFLQECSNLAAKVGDAIPVVLEIKSSCNWSGNDSPEEQEWQMTYEMETSPENWIIGGEKRGAYQAKIGTTNEFLILLLPQRPGYLPLPALDIRLSKADTGQSVHCELDYQSQAISMMVLPGIKTSTLAATLRPERRSVLL